MYKAVHDYGDTEFAATGDTPEQAVQNLQRAVDDEFEVKNGHRPTKDDADFVLIGSEIWIRDFAVVGYVVSGSES